MKSNLYLKGRDHSLSKPELKSAAPTPQMATWTQGFKNAEEMTAALNFWRPKEPPP